MLEGSSRSLCLLNFLSKRLPEGIKEDLENTVRITTASKWHKIQGTNFWYSFRHGEYSLF